MNQLAWGVDLVEEQLLASAGGVGVQVVVYGWWCMGGMVLVGCSWPGVGVAEEQLLASAGGVGGVGVGHGSVVPGGGAVASWRSWECRGQLGMPRAAHARQQEQPATYHVPMRPLVAAPLVVSAGIPSRPNVAPRPLRNIAEYSVNALKTGRLRDLDFLKPYQGRPDVLYANPLVEAGDKVGGCMGGWWANGCLVGGQVDVHRSTQVARRGFRWNQLTGSY